MGSKSKRQSRKPARRSREWQDRYYKQMFRHPEMVIDLLSGFVQPSRIDELDFATLRPLPTNYVNTRLEQRSGDCAWRVNFRGNTEYLIVLVEFQSTSPPNMVSRMWDYAGLLYADSFRDPGPWEEPEMVLIVLYSGTAEWTALRSMGKRTRRRTGRPTRKLWSSWRASLEYLLIALQKYPLEQLPPNNLVSFLIALKQTRRDPTALQPFLRGLRMRLEEIDKNDLAEAFYGWFTEVLEKSEAIDQRIDPKLPALEKLKLLEKELMNWDDTEWTESWVEEGRTEGIEKGRAEGRAEVRAEGRAEGRAEVLGMIRKRLYRQAGERFDPETVGRLTRHLDPISDPDLLWEIFDQIHEGATCATLLKRLQDRS